MSGGRTSDLADATWLRDTLVAWYRAGHRDLPWRRDPTPYHVLLSEIMCQQTRVETARPYFDAFTARWPTLDDLARADEDAVLEAWAGLGYYRRARNLLRAVRAARDLGGLPDTVEGLRELPGVGAYTAGAIASIAFGRPVPAVDGNVERVISRVDGRGEDPRKAAGRRALHARVAAITDAAVASEVTQGLMELGATVCTPRRAACGDCPWAAGCVARATGQVDALPRKAPKRPPTPVRGAAGLCRLDGRELLAKRVPGLLGGLWEPVRVDLDGDEDAAPALVRAFAASVGLRVVLGPPVGRVVHVFTHRRLTLDVFEVVEAAGRPRAAAPYEDVALAPPDDPGVGLSTLARKVLATRAAPGLPLVAEGPHGSPRTNRS